jgi:hypothetical protein
MANPEHGGSYHQDNQEKNGPGINATITFHGFRVITHRIASCRFY